VVREFNKVNDHHFVIMWPFVTGSLWSCIINIHLLQHTLRKQAM